MLKTYFCTTAQAPQRPMSNIRCVFFQTGRQTFLRECPAAPRSSERTGWAAGPSGRETSVRHSSATASRPLPACLPTHDNGSSCKAARLALGGNAKLPQGAVTPAAQPCYFHQRSQAGCCGGIKGMYRQGETAIQGCCGPTQGYLAQLRRCPRAVPGMTTNGSSSVVSSCL